MEKPLIPVNKFNTTTEQEILCEKYGLPNSEFYKNKVQKIEVQEPLKSKNDIGT